MKSGPGNQRQTGAGRGGTPGLRICTLLFLNPTLIAVNFCRCGIKGSVSSGLHEPPYTEPYVRWCGRTAEVTPPPTRCHAVFATAMVSNGWRNVAVRDRSFQVEFEHTKFNNLSISASSFSSRDH